MTVAKQLIVAVRYLLHQIHIPDPGVCHAFPYQKMTEKVERGTSGALHIGLCG